MAVTRFAAHPLVVAVALGLLGPRALEEVDDGMDDGDLREERDAHTLDLSTLPEPDAAEFERVEQAWLAARDLIVDGIASPDDEVG
jgi:hypothetical protein